MSITICLIALIFLIWLFSRSELDETEAIEVGDVRIRARSTSEYIYYRGPFTEDGFTELKRIYQLRVNKNEIPVSTLTVNSRGGNALVGLDIAEWLFKKQLNVLVTRRCLSSCANFVFVAGNKKFLFDHSELAWHGSVTDERGLNLGINRGHNIAIENLSDKELLEKYKTMFEQNFNNVKAQFPKVTYEEYSIHFLKKLREKEFLVTLKEMNLRDTDLTRVNEFYSKIGVDPMIRNYGLEQVEDSIDELPTEFYYSLKDLKRLGVDNIILRDGKWTPDYSFPIFMVDSKYIKTQGLQ